VSKAQALDLLKQGVALAKAGNKAEAREWVRRSVDLDPSSEPAWMWLASLSESRQEALAALEHILALNPANERAKTAAHAARLQAGIAAAKAQQKTEARTLLRAVIAAEPSNELAWLWLASVAESQAVAASCLEKVLAVNPANEHARAGLEQIRGGKSRDEAAKTAERAPNKARKTVLVVDDSPTIRKLVTMTLERRGYRVWTAADGALVAEVLRQQGVPDLVLLDIAMPGMDGYQLCRLLRQDKETSRLPIVMLSGKDGVFNHMRGRMAGSTAYLTKPFEPEHLLSVLGRYCPVVARSGDRAATGAAD
jgi:CheY-like chemotaxis protein